MPYPGSVLSVALRPPVGLRPPVELRQPGAPRPAGTPRPAGCEQRLESARQDGPRVPTLAVAGASFTAGIGSGHTGDSWAVLLARMLRWDAVVYGDPGAGYVRAGLGRQGPVAAEIGRIGLRALSPALVIVQAGHDDVGVPPGLERRRAEQAVASIRAQVPQARIVLLTVFTGRSRSPAAYRTDRAIVAGGTAADRQVIIIDPLAADWTFPRAPDGLHPTASGSVWIAGQVAGILREHGVLPAPAGGSAIICDQSVRAPGPQHPAPGPKAEAGRYPALGPSLP